MALIETMDEDTIPMVVGEVKTAIQSGDPEIRRGGVALVACLVPNVDEEEVDFEEHLPTVIQNTIRCFDDKDEAVRVEAVKAMKAVTDCLSKEQQLDLLSTVHAALMVSASSDSLWGPKKMVSRDPYLTPGPRLNPPQGRVNIALGRMALSPFSRSSPPPPYRALKSAH